MLGTTKTLVVLMDKIIKQKVGKTMLKTFAIIKETDKVKTEYGWINASNLCGNPYYQTRLAIIKARNRREAWKIYQPNLSKTYTIDNRSLTGERHNHNKKRRIELISVIEIHKNERGNKK